MHEYPAFLGNPVNRVPAQQQNTAGVEGYLFSGRDQTQVVFWTCREDRDSAWHVNGFDEYLVVVAGSYLLQTETGEVRLGPGDETVIPAGRRQRGRATAGTRTIHAFAGERVSLPR